jgi:hypothetical protein
VRRRLGNCARPFDGVLVIRGYSWAKGQGALKRSRLEEIAQFRCHLSDLANGFANSRRQGKDDGCRAIGRLDRASGPREEGFLKGLSQTAIFTGLAQPGTNAAGLGWGAANSFRRKGAVFLVVRLTGICSRAAEL